MDAITRTIAEQDCANLLTDYCAAFDQRRVDDAVALFLPSARWVRPGLPDVDGLEAIRTLVASAPPTVSITHVLSNIRVTVTSDGEATSRSVFTVYSGPAGGSSSAIAPVMIGEYRDRLSRTPDGWRIAHRETGYLFVRSQE